MSSVEGPILLKTKLPDGVNLFMVQLERYVDVGGNAVRRRARCPLINNETDPELACKVYEEFIDICIDTRLHLNTGPLKFEFYRQCLNGQARAHWDVAATEVGGTTDANFTESVTAWFGQYFEPTAYHDQKQYLLQATKAYSMTVKDTATRLEEMIRYMRYMPGAPAAGTPIYSVVEKKMTLYRLMRPNWKSNFDASGNDITNAAYTWGQLITYMSAQEKKENRRSASGGRGTQGGRGMGRGRGRSGGRNSYGHVRRMENQGGPPAQRFRHNNFVHRGGHYNPYVSRGYGNQGYGYGYGQSNAGYSAGYYRGGGAGRGPAPARGPPGRGRGRGRFGGRGRREVAALTSSGYTPRAARTTRGGSTYVTEGQDGNNGDDENQVYHAESFDSNGTGADFPDAEGYAEEPPVDDMYYGKGDQEIYPYDGPEYDGYDGYGDY